MTPSSFLPSPLSLFPSLIFHFYLFISSTQGLSFAKCHAISFSPEVQHVDFPPLELIYGFKIAFSQTF